MPVVWSVNWSGWSPSMGPRVPFVSNPFGTISPNKVVETKMKRNILTCRQTDRQTETQADRQAHICIQRQPDVDLQARYHIWGCKLSREIPKLKIFLQKFKLYFEPEKQGNVATTKRWNSSSVTYLTVLWLLQQHVPPLATEYPLPVTN